MKKWIKMLTAALCAVVLLCGFSVTAHLTGTITFKVLPNGLELDRLRLTYTFTGPGGTTSLGRVENVKYTLTTLPVR